MKRSAVQTLNVGSVVLKPKSEDGLRPAEMLAYTGAPVARCWGRAIFDIAGMKAGAKVPFLLDHDSAQRAGFADQVELSERVMLRGFLSPSTPAGLEVAKLSDEGFPWQASVQLLVASWEELGAGATAKVNGRDVVGPISIARQSRLAEGSFLMAGADEDTHAVALAAAKEQQMDAKAFLAASPEAVKAWRDEGSASARKDLGEFLAAFAGREAWASARFAEGLSLLQAKAALSDVLQEELTAAKAATPPAAAPDAATLATLQAQAAPGVSFNGPAAQGDAGGEEAVEALLASLPLEKRCELEWLSDENLRAEFFNKPSAYVAYKRREAEGTVAA